MILTSRAVVVEGRYDRIKLDSVTDALVVTTDGFNIRKDIEKQELIKRLAREVGLIVLTDSDDAGFQIRKYVEDIAGRENVIHAYIPEIEGKERRKSRRSSAGLLGVEGISCDAVERALRESLDVDVRVERKANPSEKPIDTCDLFFDGISGTACARERRTRFLRAAGLPTRLSTGALLLLVNRLLGRGGYEKIVTQLKADEMSQQQQTGALDS
ncbi:MAG: DUF4093 domain-containing protein [Oscillospiraceae bacterium]